MLTLQRINGEVIATGDNIRVLIEDNARNLYHTYLCDLDLQGLHLIYADFCNSKLCRVDLRCAYLHHATFLNADLRCADLRCADLRCAEMCDANLCGADLRGADLCGADLRGADLSGADLRSATLNGANLRGANLRGVRPNWQSHALIAQFLWNEAGDDVGKRKIAGVISMSEDWCWDDFLRIDDPLRDWAITVLKQYSDFPY